MIEYRFCDTDSSGMAEFDIAGIEYTALMDKCFEYCSAITLFIRDTDITLPPELEADRIPVTAEMSNYYKRYGDAGQVRAYRLTPQSKYILLSIASSIFSWIDGWGQHNPEDPVFFRADGSVFLSAVVHEGHVSLFPRDDEDVNILLKNPNWIKHSTK